MDALKTEVKTMPLAMMEAGALVRLVAVDAGQGLRGELEAMGLVPGTRIEVLRNCLHGPFIIGVRGSRIVLGRGMAHKIRVEK